MVHFMRSALSRSYRIGVFFRRAHGGWRLIVSPRWTLTLSQILTSREWQRLLHPIGSIQPGGYRKTTRKGYDMGVIAGLPIGPDHPPILLAEIGALFNQDIEMAQRLIDAVAATESQAVERFGQSTPTVLKGELLLSPDICMDDDSVEHFRNRAGEVREERYRDLIARKVLAADVYRDLIARARAKGLPVIMSVYDEAGLKLASEAEVSGVKIASSNVNHIPLIRLAAAEKKPILLDTGRSSLAEVDKAVQAVMAIWRDGGYDGMLVIQHSPDGHPALDRNHNLRSIRTLACLYGTPIGLSCHAMDEDACIAAIALGARLIEKNVCEDVGALEQDAVFALAIGALPEFSARLRRTFDRLGDRWRDPATQTGLVATSARMGLIARIDVNAGERVNADTCGFAFPCKGISVGDFDHVQGWRFVRFVRAGDVIRWSDLRAE